MHNSSEIWIFYAGEDNRVTTAQLRTVKLQWAVENRRDSPNLQIIRVVFGSELWDAPIKSLRQYVSLQARKTTRTAASISMKYEIWGVLLRCVEPSDLSFRSNSFDEHLNYELHAQFETRCLSKETNVSHGPTELNETNVITKTHFPLALRFSRWEKKNYMINHLKTKRVCFI
jgi:hypothetical protein